MLDPDASLASSVDISASFVRNHASPSPCREQGRSVQVDSSAWMLWLPTNYSTGTTALDLPFHWCSNVRHIAVVANCLSVSAREWPIRASEIITYLFIDMQMMATKRRRIGQWPCTLIQQNPCLGRHMHAVMQALQPPFLQHGTIQTCAAVHCSSICV
jgi:hypothetical protein